MVSHLHLLRLPSPPHFTNPSPWPTKMTPTPLHLPSISARKTRQLHAQGRGFGIAVPDKKPPGPKKDDSSKKDDEDEIAQEVFNIMIRRVLIFVEAPMASRIGVLYMLSFLKEHGIWDVPAWLLFLTILLGFGTSVLGIAYGTLSASWDPGREGSLFGWEEVERNWPKLWKEDENEKK